MSANCFSIHTSGSPPPENTMPRGRAVRPFTESIRSSLEAFLKARILSVLNETTTSIQASQQTDTRSRSNCRIPHIGSSSKRTKYN